MKPIAKTALFLSCLLLISVSCNNAPDQTSTAEKEQSQIQTVGGKVLLVHSYHSDYEWVASITRGVRRSLKRGIELEIFYMDTKRNTNPDWFDKIATQGLDVIDSWKPDVVILVDDNAQELIGRHLAGKEKPFIVFCGVNAKAEKYGYPAKNVTGILERPHLADTMNFIQQLKPSVKTVAMLSDDSPTTRATFEYCRKKESPAKLIGWDSPRTFSDWKKKIKSYQTTADAIAIYTYHTIKDQSGGKSLSSKEIMAWTLANSKIPIIGFLAFGIDDGMVCGVAESGVEHGLLSGEMAVALLSGTSIADLPIKIAGRGIKMFNVRSANQFGINVSNETLKSYDILVE